MPVCNFIWMELYSKVLFYVLLFFFFFSNIIFLRFIPVVVYSCRSFILLSVFYYLSTPQFIYPLDH